MNLLEHVSRADDFQRIIPQAEDVVGKVGQFRNMIQMRVGHQDAGELGLLLDGEAGSGRTAFEQQLFVNEKRRQLTPGRFAARAAQHTELDGLSSA